MQDDLPRITTPNVHPGAYAWRRLRAAGGALLRVLSPDYCAACDEPIEPGRGFCSDCGKPEPWRDPLPDGVRVAAAYAPPLSLAIQRMKFGPRPDLAPRLLEWLDGAPTAISALPGGCARTPPGRAPVAALDAAVVPVPLHFSRLVERGFNPAALLARGLAQRWGAAFAPATLVRTRATERQTELDRQQRYRNVRGAFRVSKVPLAERVVLVDDVVTTGATIRACREALYAAGVVHVSVVALAAARGGA